MAIYFIPLVAMLIHQLISIRMKQKNEYEKKWDWILSAIPFLMLLLISGLRGYEVGIDTGWVYTDRAMDHFGDISFRELIEYITTPLMGNKFEDGTAILYWVILKLTHNAQWIIFVMALFLIPCVYVFINMLSEDVASSSIIFLCGGLFLTSINIARQLVAAGFVLMFYLTLQKKKYWLSLLFAILAYGFHQSSLPVLILMGITYLLPAAPKLLVVFLGITALSPWFIRYAVYIAKIFFPKLAGYFYSGGTDAYIHGVIVTWVLETLIVLFFLTKDMNELAIEGGLTRKHVFSVLWYPMIYITLTISSRDILFIDRMAMYFQFFVLLLIPMFLEWGRKHWTGIRYYILLIGFDTLFVLWLYRSLAGDPTYLYHFFFRG